MKININRYHLLWTVAWLAVFAWLIIEDIDLDGSSIYIKDFSKNQFSISYIFPLGRTFIGPNSQTIIAEPVYFTVYAPQRFDRVIVRFTALEPSAGWQIGYQTAPGFHYALLDGSIESGKNEFIIFSTDAYVEENRFRFIFANNQLTEKEHLFISSLSVHMARDSSLAVEDYVKSWSRNFKIFFKKWYAP